MERRDENTIAVWGLSYTLAHIITYIYIFCYRCDNCTTLYNICLLYIIIYCTLKSHNKKPQYILLLLYIYILSLLLYFIHPVKISLAKIKRIILYYENVLRKKWRKNYLGRYIKFQYYYQCWDKILYKIWSTAI